MSSWMSERIPDREQERHESEEKFRALAEASSAAVFIYQGSRLCYANPAAASLSGYASAELLQMNFYDLAPVEERKRVRSWGMRAQSGRAGESQQQAIPLLTKTGEVRPSMWTVVPTEHNGKPAALLVIVDRTALEHAGRLEMLARRLVESACQATNEQEFFAGLQAALQGTTSIGNFCVVKHDPSSGRLACLYPTEGVALEGEANDALHAVIMQALSTGKTLVCTPAFWQEAMERGEVKAVPPQFSYGFVVPLPGKQGPSAALVAGASPSSATGERLLLEFVASWVAVLLPGLSGSSKREGNQHVNHFAALYEMARDLTLQRSRSHLLGAIADHALRLTQGGGCALYLFDAVQDELEAVEARGAWNLQGTRLKMGADLAGKAAETRQVMMAEKYCPEHLVSVGSPAAFAAAVPLIFGGELEGVLLVYEHEEEAGLSFRQEGMRLLTFFADIAAIALNNAALFDETRQRLVEIEVLYQASLAATQIYSVKAVAQRIAETLERLMGWQVSVWMIDAEQQRPFLLTYGGSHLSLEKRKERLKYIDSLLPSLQAGIVGWVCRTGQTVRVGDVRSDPRYVAGDAATRSELCVPLKIGGRVIGCLNMESPQENAFSEHDERLLTTLANQAAIAMENARLFEETRRRAARQTAINEVVMAATRASADLDAFLNTVLDHTLQALDLDTGALWLAPDQRRPHHVAMRGIPASLDAEMIRLQEIGEAELSRVMVVNDWSKETGPLADVLTSLGISASLVVPLYLEGRCVGGLAVAASAPRCWTEEEIDLVRVVGQEIGGAAERMRLFEETHARLQELEAINRVSMSLRSAHSLNEMLSHLLEEAARALRAPAGGIWLYDQTDGRLRLAAGHDWVVRLARAEVEREDGIARTVFASGDIYFARDVATDPLLTWPAREIVPAGWGALYVPVCTDQETIGVLMVADRSPREFSVDDARLMVTLAEIGGSAIQRMSLYEQTQRHALELEQRVAERTAELEQALQRAQEADRLKSEFIANVNHELRTPLTNLVLYYQMLRAQPNVQTEERLDVIGRELQRLRTLIEDLLNLSRLDSGRASFFPSPQNLNELLQVLVKDRRQLAEERNLELQLDLDENLPLVTLDAQMVSQAFSNLLTNALHYTPPHGRVRIRTMVGQLDDGAYVGFSVQDNGPGIDAEDLPHIFERFYRGRAGRESGASGTGLGLAIVKQVVEYHRGKIEVANGLLDGRGASFTVWLPVEDRSL